MMMRVCVMCTLLCAESSTMYCSSSSTDRITSKGHSSTPHSLLLCHCCRLSEPVRWRCRDKQSHVRECVTHQGPSGHAYFALLADAGRPWLPLCANTLLCRRASFGALDPCGRGSITTHVGAQTQTSSPHHHHYAVSCEDAAGAQACTTRPQQQCVS